MLVVVILGVMKEINDAPHTPTTLMKVGAVGLLACWVFLAIWALISWYQPPSDVSEGLMYADGTMVSPPPPL